MTEKLDKQTCKIIVQRVFENGDKTRTAFAVEQAVADGIEDDLNYDLDHCKDLKIHEFR